MSVLIHTYNKYFKNEVKYTRQGVADQQVAGITNYKCTQLKSMIGKASELLPLTLKQFLG